MGTPEMKDVENRLFASELKCAIYSVEALIGFRGGGRRSG
jgi:hypothetical protein